MLTAPMDRAPDRAERRRFDRLPLNKPVSVLCCGRMISGMGHNLSGNGVLLSLKIERTWMGRSMERALAVGTPLRVFLPTSGPQGDIQSVNVVGKIVRVSKQPESDEVMVGLAFE
jgi:hypothetical protein